MSSKWNLIKEWPSTMCVIGRPNSGKTTAMRNLLKDYWQYFDYAIVFSPTIHNGDYNFLGKKGIFLSPMDFDEKIAKIIMEQKKNILQGNLLRVVVIFDDCASLIRSSKALNYLINTHRHWLCNVWFAAQDIKDIQPRLRSLCKYCIFFRPSGERDIKELYSCYFQCMNSYRTFRSWLINKFQEKYVFCFVDTLLDTRKFYKC